MNAIIPVLWRWADADNYAGRQALADADGHNDLPDGWTPPAGPSLSERYWLAERYDRWVRDAQVRG